MTALPTSPSSAPLPQLAVFDMAGTTIDDHGLVYDALRTAVEELDAPVDPADLQRYMGAEKRYAICRLAALAGVELSSDAADRQFERFRALLRDLYAVRPPVGLPGVAEAIDQLRAAGVRVALTTGFSADIGGPLLDSLGWWERLDAVVYASEVAQGRPAPYMIFRAMEATGVLDVATVLVAGDTVVDLQSAVNAAAGWRIGVLTGALTGQELRGHGESHILGGVRDIPQLLGLATTTS